MDTEKTDTDHNLFTHIKTAELAPFDENSEVGFEVPLGGIVSLLNLMYRVWYNSFSDKVDHAANGLSAR